MGASIPGFMFCGRQHLSLSSDEAINSLDTVGSLEGVSLPGGEQMKKHSCECKQVISMDCKSLSSDHFFSRAGGLEGFSLLASLPNNYSVLNGHTSHLNSSVACVLLFYLR